MFGDGDVATGIATCFDETGIDMMMGIGGGPEGVITAAAIQMHGWRYASSNMSIN